MYVSKYINARFGDGVDIISKRGPRLENASKSRFIEGTNMRKPYNVIY